MPSTWLVIHVKSITCCGFLQTTLVRDMAQLGELSLAEDYRKQLGLPTSVLTVDPEQLAAQELARRKQYIQIEQYINPEDQLLFVCDEADLLRASEVLGGSDVLGLDVEWKPTHVAGVTSPAALLQVGRWCWGLACSDCIKYESVVHHGLYDRLWV